MGLHILTILFRLLLTFNATSLLLIVYQVKSPLFWADSDGFFKYLLYFLYVAIPILLTRASIALSKYLSQDNFKLGSIQTIELANNSFLPSYLGYFFVALSVPNGDTLAFVYAVLFTFTFMSQALYFNPIFLLYGFSFYNATTRNGTSFFLVTRASYRTPGEIEISSASRINSFTFFERS